MTDRGWREVLVDVADDADTRHLRLVLAPGSTPASRVLLPIRLSGLPEAERAAHPRPLRGCLHTGSVYGAFEAGLYALALFWSGSGV